MTAFAEKLKAAGFSKAPQAGYVEACQLLRACEMNLEHAQAFLRLAYADMTAKQIRAEDHFEIAQSGQPKNVPSASPIASDEAVADMAERPIDRVPPARESHHLGDREKRGDNARATFVPEVPPNRALDPTASVRPDQRDLVNPRPPIASEAISTVAAKPIRDLPARDPSPGFIRATIAAKELAARSVLDTVKIEDGRAWRDVCPYEVGTWMKRDYIRGTALLTLCGPLNDKQSRMSFGELLTPERAKIAFDHAQKELAHVA